MLSIRKLSRIIGAAGVAASENAAARKVGLVFEVPMLVAVLGMLFRWWAETSSVEFPYESRQFDLFLWGFFVVESVLLSWLVGDTRRYLRENWLNLVIIVLGVTFFLGWEFDVAILRILRLLIVFSLLVHVSGRVRKMLSRNELGTTLIASGIVIVMSGVIMAVLEPTIDSPLDGIWWAWVTVTTVGYGDFVPTTVQSRLFASLVILMGIGLFAMLTATFAAFFISRKEAEVVLEEREQGRKILDLEDKIYKMEQKLDQVLHELQKKQ
jgi:voltage-gated potassium channel